MRNKSVRSVTAAALVPVTIAATGYGHVRNYFRGHYRDIKDSLTQTDIDKHWDKYSPDQKFDIGFNGKFVTPSNDLIAGIARQLAGWQSKVYRFTSDDRKHVAIAVTSHTATLVENGVSPELITKRCQRLLAEFTAA